MNMWWRDALFHLLAYPIYQILGTIRHELAHVIAYWLSGYGVKELRVFPFRDTNGTFYWGRVLPESRMGATHNVHMHLAPYYVNTVLCGAWAIFAMIIWERTNQLSGINEQEYNVLLAITILTFVSPIVDTGYNLLKYLWRGTGDFARAAEFRRLH